MRSQRHSSLFQPALQLCTWSLFVMHSALPARPQPLVRSLQLVEVRPHLEERNSRHIGRTRLSQFRDDFASQYLDWCKTPRLFSQSLG